MRHRIAVWSTVVVLVAVACSSGGDDSTAPSTSPTSSTSSTSSTTSTLVAAFETGTVEETFTDAERGRSLRTVIHYPEGAGPYPLVVFSHGITATPEIYASLTTAMARHGYVVAVPEFPKTSRAVENARANLLDVNNQPADVSFVIDEVLALSEGEGGELSGRVDPERIGAAGHSLGAITTMMLTYHSCCIDPRVDAAVALAGAALFGTGDGGYFEGTDTPLLMVHGDDDGLVVFGLGRMAFRRASPPKFFVTLLGGKHSPPFLGAVPWFEVVEASVSAFLDRYVGGDPGALDRLAGVAEVEGVSTFEAVPG